MIKQRGDAWFQTQHPFKPEIKSPEKLSQVASIFRSKSPISKARSPLFKEYKGFRESPIREYKRSRTPVSMKP